MSTTMSKLRRIAIVGRPNVGKSTLLNRLAGSRIAIVEPTAGVTRDRIAVEVRLPTDAGDRHVEAIDTGGIGIVDRDDLGPHVESQVAVALAGADLILFMVDVRDGLVPLDREVANRLRGVATPVLLVVNKVEGERTKWDVDSFRQLGLAGEPVAISAQNGEGIYRLVAAIEALLPAPEPHELSHGRPEPGEGPDPVMKLGVVGRRNAGKSTFINKLAGEERMIVSEIPGTTRDAVDVRFELHGQPFIAIDTAGIRKKSSFADAIEFYSDARAHKTVRRADVVLLLFDVTERLGALDKRLARYVVDHYKPVILGANKWDLAGGHTPADFKRYVESELPGLAWAPVSFLSAKEGRGVRETLALAQELHAASRTRVTTAELNRVLERATKARSPSSSGHRVKIFYATQVDVAPPRFVLFVNDKRLIGKDYLRYLTNRLREELPFDEVPIQIALRDKREDDAPH